MKEEILKKAFKVSVDNLLQQAESDLVSLAEKRDLAKERSKHISDISRQISQSLNQIIAAASRVPDATRSAFFDSEIKNLDLKIQLMVKQLSSDIDRLSGAIEATEAHIGTIKKLPDALESQISRANEIQEMQESGSLGERRKPGNRPIRMKDVRNYAEADKNEQG
jgi:hypothetical protein